MLDCNCPLKEAAKDAPHLLAIGSTTFQELDQMASVFALRLSRLDIQEGDRVAISHPPCPELVALFFAIWRLKASFCPLSLRLPSSQIESHLQRVDAKLFIHSFPFSTNLRKPYFSPLPFPSTLFFTSGSTSIPKIAILSKSALLWNAKTANIALNLQKQDKWLLNLPLYHVAGLGILLRCILARAQTILDENDPEITHISAVPTQLYRATPLYRNLKCLLIGGAPISTYPEKLPCFVSYGLTEMGSLVAMRERPTPIFGKLPVGFPLTGREMRLSFEGEIEVRGECLFSGYWMDGTINPMLSPDGWFSTRDIGRFTEEGLLILGRKDLQFISGGENIQPEEIEEILQTFPEVIEAVVLPKPDPEYGFRPIALVRAPKPIDPASLSAFLSEHLPKFKIPKQFFMVDDFPRKGIKIDRMKLISSFEQHLADPIDMLA